MNTRFERNERYLNGNVQLEHSLITFNNNPSETYFLTIDGEETAMSDETFGRLCEIVCKIIEAVKDHDAQA